MEWECWISYQPGAAWGTWTHVYKVQLSCTVLMYSSPIVCIGSCLAFWLGCSARPLPPQHFCTQNWRSIKNVMVIMTALVTTIFSKQVQNVTQQLQLRELRQEVWKLLVFVPLDEYHLMCYMIHHVIRHMIHHMIHHVIRHVICHVICHVLFHMIYHVICQVICHMIFHGICQVLCHMICHLICNVICHMILWTQQVFHYSIYSTWLSQYWKANVYFLIILSLQYRDL
jgi:hypothetical protein